MAPCPALEGGICEGGLPHDAVVAPELHVGVGVLGVGLDGALQVVHDLEGLVAPERYHRESHPGRNPLRVELQSAEEAELGLLQAVQVQQSPAHGLHDLGVLRGGRERLLEAGEGLLDQALAREGLPLLQILLVVHQRKLNQMDECVQSSEGNRKGGRLKRAPVLKRIAIRYKDLDPYGHVNNAVYLEFFEAIRIAYWRALSGFSGIENLEAVGPPPARAAPSDTSVS